MEDENITDYALEITADSASGTATQEFLLAVDDPITLTGPATYRGADGESRLPQHPRRPRLSRRRPLTESGALPAGLDVRRRWRRILFCYLEPRVATAAPDDVYPITITAHNGFDPDATFTTVLTIEPPSDPGITSPTSDTVEAEVPFDFTVTSSGAPMPQLRANGVGSGFHLPPAFPDAVSASSTTETEQRPLRAPCKPLGPTSPSSLRSPQCRMSQVSRRMHAQRDRTGPSPPSPAPMPRPPSPARQFSFTVTTTGTPTPALSFSGTLPADLQFQDNGDGTATISRHWSPLTPTSGSTSR